MLSQRAFSWLLHLWVKCYSLPFLELKASSHGRMWHVCAEALFTSWAHQSPITCLKQATRIRYLRHHLRCFSSGRYFGLPFLMTWTRYLHMHCGLARYHRQSTPDFPSIARTSLRHTDKLWSVSSAAFIGIPFHQVTLEKLWQPSLSSSGVRGCPSLSRFTLFDTGGATLVQRNMALLIRLGITPRRAFLCYRLRKPPCVWYGVFLFVVPSVPVWIRIDCCVVTFFPSCFVRARLLTFFQGSTSCFHPAVQSL